MSDEILNPSLFDGTHLSFITNLDKPGIYPAGYDFWAYIDVDVVCKELELGQCSTTPDWIRYANKSMERLGYGPLYHFPVSWHGGGCSIFIRSQSQDNDLYKQFKFFAVYAPEYNGEVLLIGIYGYPELLQFQRLIRPALMLQTEKRFLSCGTDHSEAEIEGMWNDGKNWRDVYRAISCKEGA